MSSHQQFMQLCDITAKCARDRHMLLAVARLRRERRYRRAFEDGRQARIRGHFIDHHHRRHERAFREGWEHQDELNRKWSR